MHSIYYQRFFSHYISMIHMQLHLTVMDNVTLSDVLVGYSLIHVNANKIHHVGTFKIEF